MHPVTFKPEPPPPQALPCPFCLSLNLGLLETIDGRLRVKWVYCKKCTGSGPHSEDEREAVRRWNGGRVIRP